LHCRNDLIIHVVAGKWISRSRPGIRQIDADKGGTFSKTDTSFKPTLLVNLPPRIGSWVMGTRVG